MHFFTPKLNFHLTRTKFLRPVESDFSKMTRHRIAPRPPTRRDRTPAIATSPTERHHPLTVPHWAVPGLPNKANIGRLVAPTVVLILVTLAASGCQCCELAWPIRLSSCIQVRRDVHDGNRTGDRLVSMLADCARAIPR